MLFYIALLNLWIWLYYAINKKNVYFVLMSIFLSEASLFQINSLRYNILSD